jgi:outer membrane protein TolC
MQNRNHYFFLLLAAILPFSSLHAQKGEELKFSLEEAQAYALENSYQSRSAKLEVEKSQKKVNETIGTGLPQVNASASYQNYLELPVQVIPAESFGGPPGEFAEVVFGVEQQMGFDATATQLIFDGSYFVGLQAAKVYKELAENDLDRSELDVNNLVLRSYASVLVAESTAEVQKGILDNLESNFDEAEARFEAGFLAQEDKDQIELLYINAKNAFQQAQRQIPITRAQLKYILGVPLSNTIVLTDSLFPLLESLPGEEFLQADYDVINHIDYKIAATQLEASELLMKQQKSNYLPKLNAFFTYQENSFSNEFDFFSGAQWYPTQLLGLNFTLPIFSGLSRHNQVQQAKIEMEQVDLNRQAIEQQLQINVNKAKSDYLFALQQFENRKENWKLAQRIYRNTEVKYREGLSGSTDLTQANNQRDESLANYVQAALQLINSKAELNQALNIR